MPAFAGPTDRAKVLAGKASNDEGVGVVPDVFSAFGGWRCGHVEVRADTRYGFVKGPAGEAHEEVHAGSGATHLVAATALIAEPGASAIAVIEAITVFAAAERTGLVLIGKLLWG